MKYFYSFLVLLLIQWGAKNVLGAPIGSEITKCVASDKVQYTHHFECACHPEHVHNKIEECIKKDTLVKCGPSDTEGKSCGEYAACVKPKPPARASAPKDGATETVCQCLAGYSTDETTTETLNSCQLEVCKGITCDNGKCVKNAENAAVCSCHIGYSFDANKKCTVKQETKPACTLTCGTNEECVIQDDKFYKCKCIDGKEPVNGVCGSAFKSTLSTANALFLMIILVISLKWA